MTEADVRQLLAVVTSWDNRNVGRGTLLAWSEAARRGRWTLGAAIDAVHDYYTNTPGPAWIMPGDVTTRIAAQRSKPPPAAQRRRELAENNPADPERIRRYVAAISAQLDADRQRTPRPDDRRRAWLIRCSYCRAEPQHACWQTTAGRPNGTRMSEPHRQRLADARAMRLSESTEDEEDRT